ncbi:hypothetical protein F5Y01DRAFT_219930 [Xylaria sp. FL0043]|nr:hypothetical protein F5Y01DRAFT_219930 [Xylaria sp. FL0043]
MQMLPSDSREMSWMDLLARAVDNLPLAHRDAILQLSARGGARTQGEKVGQIFRTKSFWTGNHDGKSNFQSLFTTGEYFYLV